VREWLVASGLIESADGGLLLVQNLRRDGSLDWSPPGGVVEVHDGESPADGLTREVEEETGLRVTEWQGPIWHVEAEAPEMGWHLKVEVFRARSWTGELSVGTDPDGIVVDARFVTRAECPDLFSGAHRWVHEPMQAWLFADGIVETLRWRYRVEGASPRAAVVTRL
jgi:8-oxo-dGTP diphosphatase